VEAATASYIFDLMEKFAGYGFNKSHSAAYALVSYQTAWLKAALPGGAFMAAVLSADMDNTDKVVNLIEECRVRSEVSMTSAFAPTAQKINRRTLEALIRAGALDSIGPNRATLMANLPKALSRAEQHLRNESLGQEDLFGGPVTPDAPDVHDEQLPEWDEDLRLSAEKETLGLYLTGHPIDRFQAELQGHPQQAHRGPGG
jgi:DNA polymerase III subunit alpha